VDFLKSGLQPFLTGLSFLEQLLRVFQRKSAIHITLFNEKGFYSFTRTHAKRERGFVLQNKAFITYPLASLLHRELELLQSGFLFLLKWRVTQLGSPKGKWIDDLAHGAVCFYLHLCRIHHAEYLALAFEHQKSPSSGTAFLN
jgi:hypothetical protein